MPDVATLTALLSSHQTNDNPQQKLEAGLDKSNETSTPDFGRKSLVGLGCGPGSHDEVEASSPHANARNNRSQGSPSRTKATASQTDFAIEPAVDPSTPHADTDHSRVLETSRIRSEVESPSGSPGVNPSRTALSPSDEPTPLENSHLSAGERGLQILGEADREGASQDTSPISENAFASRKKDREKPAPLTGLSSFADQPSSPTSTLGPYSSNTPGVTAGSPDTSPDEELPAGVQQTRGTASLPKSLPASSVSNMSAGVPSIPEERSRMEVAHSLDSSSIPDHQSNGEAASTSQTETSDSGMKAQSNAESSLAKDYHHPTNGANSFGESEISRTPSLKPDGPPATHSTAVDEDAVMEDAPDDQPNPPTLSEEQKQPSSRKPTMWIDTKTASGVTPSDHPVTTAGSGPDRMVESPVTIASSITPKRPHLPSSSSAQSPPERMTTRVSSGAIRHKSVSEILGETPKHGPAQPDRSAADKMSSDSSRAGSVADSPIPVSGRDTPEPLTIKLRHGERTLKEKERSKLSTVVFAKPQTMDRSDGVEPVPRQNVSEASQSSNAEKDYLFTLFQQRAYFPPRSLQLSTLLSSAHKTLTTSNLYIDHQEQMDCRSLRRIYHLQNANRWPLRQMQRSVEPERPTSHWDFVLSEMKWMRTDYREEKKWKIAAAAACADWCAEFVASDREQRRKLQVTVKARMAPLQADGSRDVEMVDDRVEAATSNAHPTPDLVPSAEDDSVSDGVVEDPSDLFDSAAPAAIFSLPSSDFTFQMKRTPATEKLLDELPLYEPVKWVPGTELPNLAAVSDSAWKTDLLPVSKYATGKIRFKENKPPRKRSRYEYEEYSAVRDRAIILTPEQTDVALFMPENKHIRDRIHPGHSFRPPTEHPMPAQAFFESRQSSQWTVTEDDELRRLVKEYSYNWSLISSCLSSPSLFSSGAERRTPWECFERWIGLEGLPADMSKTPYFRAYHSRIEAAQRTVLAQQHAAQQQQGSNPNQGPMRRRTTQPVRVDRRRSSKHLALLDAMRKLAKKRETALQKQQHGKTPSLHYLRYCHPPSNFVQISANHIDVPAAGLAAMRKANEATQPRPPISMPQEFSRLKHERECKMQERQELYRQQVLAHQRVDISLLTIAYSKLIPYSRPPCNNEMLSSRISGTPSLMGLQLVMQAQSPTMEPVPSSPPLSQTATLIRTPTIRPDLTLQCQVYLTEPKPTARIRLA